MVRQCSLCKKLDYLNPDVSFHRFPTNAERRKLWYSLLGFEEEKVLRKCTDICSNHFNDNDFEYKPSGRKFLKKDAKPRFPRDIFRRELWLKNLNVTEQDIRAVKDAKVCSDHFSPETLFSNNSETVHLKFNAVPMEPSVVEPQITVKSEQNILELTSPSCNLINSNTLVEASNVSNVYVETYYDSTADAASKNNPLRDHSCSTTLTESTSEVESPEGSPKYALFVNTRSCVVCNEPYREGEETSFHIIPRDKRRSLWLRILNIPEDAAKYSWVCSNHFSPTDFVVNPSGRKHLKKNAIPNESARVSLYVLQRTDLCSSSALRGSEQVTTSPSSTPTPSEHEIKNCQSPIPIATEHIMKISPASTPTGLDHGMNSSSSTLTASETGMNSPSSSPTVSERGMNGTNFPLIDWETISSSGSSNENSPKVKKLPKKRFNNNPRYLGDVSPSDMDDPMISRRILRISKQTILQQNRKIGTLQKANRRLKQKVNDLNALTGQLRQHLCKCQCQ